MFAARAIKKQDFPREIFSSEFSFSEKSFFSFKTEKAWDSEMFSSEKSLANSIASSIHTLLGVSVYNNS